MLPPITTTRSQRPVRPRRFAALVAALILALASRPDAQGPEMATIIVELSSTAGDARAAVREQVEAAAAVSNAADADVARAQAVHRGIDRSGAATRPPKTPPPHSSRALVDSAFGRSARPHIVIYRAPLSALPAIQAHPGIRSAYVDQEMKASLAVATASMGVPTFWNAGLTGGSVDVAVVDSGIYGGNEAFAPRISSIYCGVYHVQPSSSRTTQTIGLPVMTFKVMARESPA